jgi:hypothetical protein
LHYPSDNFVVKYDTGEIHSTLSRNKVLADYKVIRATEKLMINRFFFPKRGQFVFNDSVDFPMEFKQKSYSNFIAINARKSFKCNNIGVL